ncbi:hypothetical protein BD560DRAFT_451347 [Blakeslea trispora]|nr:hypothetical protein BD560DRAFT_451347 [Blakeslea trispora]
MKLLSNLATLSIAATLVLQSGNFVSATPFFNVPTDANVHSNAASLDADSCDGFRVTYPFSSGLSFEEESKHIVAWQAPDGMKKVNVTLIDNTLAESQAYIGLFDASQGATEEFPLSLGNKDAGEYRFHLSAQGDSQYCEADSVPFQITKRAVPETSSEDNNNSDDAEDNDEAHEDDANWDSALSKVTNLTSEDKPHNNDGSSTETNDKNTFHDYINSLDQDYKPYLAKNKETETEDVTHKNEAEDIDVYATNQDSTAQTSAHKASWHSNDASSYFTDEDQSSTATIYHNDSEWVNEDNVSDETHLNDDSVWEEEVAGEVEHVDSNEFIDDVHENIGEWYSNDESHDNDWSVEHVDVAHANSYGLDFDYDHDPEDGEDDEDRTHNNGWVAEGDEHLNADGWTAEAVDVVDHPNYHVNDAEWSSSADHTDDADTTWESEAVDMVDHPNFHANEEFEGDGEHVDAVSSESNWVPEDAEHTNDDSVWEEEVAGEVEHVDSNEFIDDVHENIGEWYSNDESHDNDWSVEHVDVAHANSYGLDFDYDHDPEDGEDDEDRTHNNGWVAEGDEHLNADGWTAEAVDVVDHPNYHVNDAEWSSSADHTDDADTTWETEAVDMADHPNFHTNEDGEWNDEEFEGDGQHVDAVVSESNWVSHDDSSEHDNYYIRNVGPPGDSNEDHRRGDGWDFSNSHKEENIENSDDDQIASDATSEWLNNELDSVTHSDDSSNWVSEADEHDNDVPSWVEHESSTHVDDIPEEVALLQDDFAYKPTTEHSNASDREWTGY